ARPPHARPPSTPAARSSGCGRALTPRPDAVSIDHASMLERKKGVEMSMSRRRVMEAGAGGALAAAAAACARPDQAASNDLAELDAVETAARIKSGELSAKEAVDAAIERAARIDKKLNAIAFKTFDRAREEAGATQGPWAGVPS